MKFEIDTLGIIRSPYKEKFAIPRQPGLVKSARARLELVNAHVDLRIAQVELEHVLGRDAK